MANKRKPSRDWTSWSGPMVHKPRPEIDAEIDDNRTEDDGPRVDWTSWSGPDNKNTLRGATASSRATMASVYDLNFDYGTDVGGDIDVG